MRLLPTIVLSLAALSLDAQTVKVFATRLIDHGVPADGTIYFEPLIETGKVATYRNADGRAIQIAAQQATVRSGAFTLILPDTSQTEPADLCFAVRLKTGNGIPKSPDVDCVQPHGIATSDHDWCHQGSCNLDRLVAGMSPHDSMVAESADSVSFISKETASETPRDSDESSKESDAAFRVATVYHLRGTRKGAWIQNIPYGYGDIVDAPCGSYMSVAYPNVNTPPSLSPDHWLPLSSNCSPAITGTLSLNANMYSSGFHILDAHKNRGLTVFLEGGYSSQSYAQLRSNASLLLDGFGGATGAPLPSVTNPWSPPGGGGNTVWAVRVGYWDPVGSTARSQRWSETDTPIGAMPYTGIGRSWAFDQSNLPYTDHWAVPPGSTMQWTGYSTFKISSPVQMSVVQQDAGVRLASSNITLSAGWGSHASISSIKGFSNKMRFVIVAGTAPTVNPAVSIAFPTPFVANPPLCTPTQIGGSGSQPKAFTHGTESMTSTGTMTWLGTPETGSTYEVEVSCE